MAYASKYKGIFPVDAPVEGSVSWVRFFGSIGGSGRPPILKPMPEGYCVKCKAKKEIADAVEETMKNGRKAIKGRCPTCGVVMFKILGSKPSSETAPTAPPPAS